jgi:hypothetical protein
LKEELMTAMQKITRDDIIDPDAYAGRREEHRKRYREIKKHRRVDVGPVVSFYFESRETMWHQIQEMVHIERGGEEQIADELDAYNPLVPEGRDLRCTMMIEIDDEARRDAMLRKLGWIDEKVQIVVGERRIPAEPLQDAERNTPDGKTSSVHFLVFRFDDEAVAAFRDEGVPARLEIAHESYGHGAAIAGEIRKALAADFD